MDTPGVNGVVTFTGSVNGARVGPARITRAYRAIETRDRNAILRNIRIEGIRATNLERDGIRLRGKIDNLVIRDFALSMRERPQTPPHLPEGIGLFSGQNITISDGTASGFRMVPQKGIYTNGDGIAAERAVRGLRIERVSANDNSDAGFDLKSSKTYLNDLTASRNYRSYRFWGDVTAGTLTSIDPRNAHIWAAKGAVVRINRLVARSRTRAPLIVAERGARVEIGSCQLALAANTQVVRTDGAATIRLGPGCRR